MSLARTVVCAAGATAAVLASTHSIAQQAEPPTAGELEPIEVSAEPVVGAPADAVPEQAAAAEASSEAPVEVTVAGTSLARTSGSAHIVREKQLERFEHDDPHAVLLTIPGVYVRGEEGFGLRPNIGLRGVSSDRSKKVALMEDGVPFAPAPYSAPAAYYFPLLTRMSAVRVIKGPSTVSYGPQTVGGAIDLRTRSIPGESKGAIDLAGGEYAYGKLHTWYGTSNERSGFLIEGVHLRNDGYKELDGGGDTGFVRNEWMVKGRHVPDPDARVYNELTLKLGYSDEDSDETYLGLSDEHFRANPNRRYRPSALDHMKWHRTQVVLGHLVQFSPEIELRTSVYRHDFTRSWRKLNAFRGAGLSNVLANPESAQNAVFMSVLTGFDSSSPDDALLIGPNQRDFVSQGIQVVASAKVPQGPLEHRLEYGVRYHHDSVRRLHTEDAFVMQGGELVPEGGPTSVTTDNDAASHAVAMHAVDAVSWRRLTLTPGLRIESVRSELDDRFASSRASGHQLALLPGLGAFFALTNDFGVLAGVYRGFSPAPPGQPVEPEQSTNYEAGVRFVHRKARAELIGFFNDYENLTDICTFSNGCLDANLDRQFDAGRAHIYGLEAYAEHEIESAGWVFPFTAAYTLTRAEFLSTFESEDPQFGVVEEGDELPYVPAHQAGITAGVGQERWQAALGAVYSSPMRETAGQGTPAAGEETDALFSLEASGEYRLTRALRIYLNARNLLDRRSIVSRRPYGARPNAPRWIQLGLKLDI